MEFGTYEIAKIYAVAYNGTILPNIALDKEAAVDYNDSVVIDGSY